MGERFCKLLEPIPKDVYSVGSNEMLIRLITVRIGSAANIKREILQRKVLLFEHNEDKQSESIQACASAPAQAVRPLKPACQFVW